MGVLDDVRIHRLPNGITLLGELMPHVSSAAFSIMVPIGAAIDPEGQDGSANLLAEMFNKGAGPWDSKALSAEFENLGAQRSHAAGVEVSMFSGALLGQNLPKVLRNYATVLLEPHFPAEDLENLRLLAIQEIKSLDDEPSSKVMVELAQQLYPHPFGRPQMGTLKGVKAVSVDSLRQYYKEAFVPEHAIIAVAGKFDWEEIKGVVEESFGGWSGKRDLLERKTLSEESKVHHIQQDTSQLQIALAYPSVSVDHEDYYAARIAVGVLSGGMAGRLFIEVREKRGLVYRVSASHSAVKGRAAVIAYAGTTEENGEECLSVMLTELRKLKDGVTDEELQRAKADLKSRLIIQYDLSSSCASHLVNDWWGIKRVRSLEEIKSGIDAVSDADICRHLEEFPVNPTTLVTLGAKSLELPA